jgi:hypothetical protein
MDPENYDIDHRNSVHGFKPLRIRTGFSPKAFGDLFQAFGKQIIVIKP